MKKGGNLPEKNAKNQFPGKEKKLEPYRKTCGWRALEKLQVKSFCKNYRQFLIDFYRYL
jgi:hypothetical protein